jgi:hypothetical protein
MISGSSIRALALAFASLCTLTTACKSELPPPGPSGRASDPPLTHSWTMPAAASPVAEADLGTKPESIADAMMQDGKIAGLVHRLATRCAEDDQLPRPGMVVLRFALSESGSLLEVEGDPPAPGGCLARALEGETDALKSLPAGAALVRIQLHPPTPE